MTIPGRGLSQLRLLIIVGRIAQAILSARGRALGERLGGPRNPGQVHRGARLLLGPGGKAPRARLPPLLSWWSLAPP